MKKLFIVLALVGLTASVQAQTEIPREKYSVSTNSFGSNCFVGMGLDIQAFYCDEERGMNQPNINAGRIGLGFDFYIGKWFTPGIGVRLRGQLGQGRKIWGTPSQQVLGWSEDNTYCQINMQGEVMFNLNNLFCGYNPKRFWTISPYVGFGVAHRMVHEGDWTPTGSIGLYNEFRLTYRWHITLDAYAQLTSAEFDGITHKNMRQNYNIIDSRDNWYGISLGLGLNIGNVGWNKTPDVAAIMALHNEQLAVLNQQIADQEAENARLKNMLANMKPQVTERERVVREVLPGAPTSVFFNINSSRVASKKDLVNVRGVAEVAKRTGGTVLVIGYADSRTGSAAYNKSLSEKRAQTVVDALVRMGVKRSQIEVNAAGGVNDLAPYTYNRRVVVRMK